jgi:RNA polymerase sigma factor (sigma-70 family)
MMTTRMMSVAANTDAELVGASLSGNRDAFGQIVARYQSLVCSLAYSATGSLSQSEDLAQEIFVTAWKQLAGLREPEKLRAWLCGIARNLIHNSLRKQGREPSHHAELLEEISEKRSPEPLPVEQAISKEEAEILWRSLEKIPEIYREPLVLFYREHQSVEAVAQNLELTEDAVKQRLSRGRKLLQEQVLVFVEGALARTNPGRAFTLAVLASLPAMSFSAKVATVGAAAKAGTTAKTAGAMGFLGMLLGPLVVFVPNYIGYRVALAGAQSEAERTGIKMLYRRLAVITLALFILVTAVVLWLTRNQTDRGYLSGLLATLLVFIFLPTMILLAVASKRRSREYYVRVLAQEHRGVFPNAAWEFCSETKLFGLPLVHIRFGDRFAMLRKPVKAWIAVGYKAVGGWFALGVGAIAPVSAGGFSIGLLSFGGLSVGGVAAGGIALGVWPLFGGLLIGWQAFDGCFALAWNAAAGTFALAHEFALGHFACAAQVNNEVARHVILPNPFFRWAEFINRHWLWLNLFWLIPFFILWRTSKKIKTGE